ncbi:hypothetical protein LOZ58_002014 [Ophidiomyces ophidiicola]|nr:hypothetical protein LOZ58_002014 [Ophidiomyces ophidiicola]
MDKPLPLLPSDAPPGAISHPMAENASASSGVPEALPTEHDLDQAFKIPILDSYGKEQLFGDVFDNLRAQEKSRVMVIFVRHFFCGSCQDYIQTLSSSIPPPSSLPSNTSLVIIGCGATSLIPMYAKETSCPFQIYTDPSSRLYSIFGMTRTWSLGPVPEYLRHSTFALVVKGISQGLRRTFNGDALKSGDMAQVGGEFFFEIKPKSQENGRDIIVTWGHRMKTTRDHTEVPELKRIMGLD